MMAVLRSARPMAAALLACALSACGSSRPIGGPTPIEPTDTAILFTETLSVGGRSFFSFVIDQRRALSLTLASTMASVTGPATPMPLRLSLGVPSGTDCVATEPAVTVAPALIAQIEREVEAGTYCARVEDPGTMSAPLTFAVRIVIAVGQVVRPTPGTDLYATSVAVQGATSRSVEASQAGIMRVTLQGLGAGAPQLGVGIGIPRADGSGCFLSLSVFTSPGGSPQIEVPVAAGQYCVRVFDPGTLITPVTFTLQIEFP